MLNKVFRFIVSMVTCALIAQGPIYAADRVISAPTGGNVVVTSPLKITSGIKGSNSGNAIPAGYLNYTTEATPTDTTATTSYADVAASSITVTPGKWRLSADLTGYITTGSAAGNAAQLLLQITDSANNAVAGTYKIFTLKTVANVANETYLPIHIEVPVTVATNTTYKIRIKRGDLNGTNVAGIAGNAGNYDNRFTATQMD